jgi:hypothetical protein
MKLMTGELKILLKSVNIFDDKTTDHKNDPKKLVRIFWFGS